MNGTVTVVIGANTGVATIFVLNDAQYTTWSTSTYGEEYDPTSYSYGAIQQSSLGYDYSSKLMADIYPINLALNETGNYYIAVFFGFSSPPVSANLTEVGPAPTQSLLERNYHLHPPMATFDVSTAALGAAFFGLAFSSTESKRRRRQQPDSS